MTGHISLHADGSPATADVMAVPDGRSFIRLAFGGISIFLPDYDADAVRHARSIAERLREVADALEATLATAQAEAVSL